MLVIWIVVPLAPMVLLEAITDLYSGRAVLPSAARAVRDAIDASFWWAPAAVAFVAALARRVHPVLAVGAAAAVPALEGLYFVTALVLVAMTGHSVDFS
jgi:hypothetical protein